MCRTHRCTAWCDGRATKTIVLERDAISSQSRRSAKSGILAIGEGALILSCRLGADAIRASRVVRRIALQPAAGG
ncbi:hypothetical protein VTO73DRAFT_12220 [Trametes versicolor]